MTTIEQIHQHLTAVGANDCRLSNGRMAFLRVTSPVSNASSPRLETWAVELFISGYPDHLLEASFQSPSLSEAAEDMLNYLRERDKSQGIVGQ